MAKEIGQLSVKIGLDSSGFQNGIGKLNQEMRKVQSEFKLASAEMGKHGKELDSLKLKSDSLTKQTEIQRQKVQALEAAHQKSVETKGQDAKATQDLEIKLNQAKTQLVNMENNLKTLNHEIEVQSSGWGKLSKSLEPLGQSLQNVGQKMEAVGKNLSMKVTAPLMGLGAAATKAGSDFEAGMSEVKAISGATGEDFAKLQEKAKEMGTTTKFSASEASEGLKYMAMAGWDTNQMLEGLDGIMMLAAASGEDLGMVSDIVTDALTAFGMEAKQAGEFADLLASASSNSNTNVAMLGESFKYVAPLFGALCYSAEDAALALGLMANAGIKSSQAGTSLRSAITNLANPSKTAATAMDQLGISITDADGQMLSFKEVMDELRVKFADLTEEQQAQYAAMIFGKEAMSGMLAIINASEEDYAKLTDATRNYTGVAKEMAEVMEDNLQGSITVLKSGLEGLAINLFQILLPHLNQLVGMLQQAVDWFANLSPATQETIVKVAALAVAIGPVLLVGGKLIGVIGSIAGVFSTVFGAIAVATTGAAAATPAIGALATAFTVLTGPVGIAVAALAGVTAAGVALYEHLSQESIPAIELFGDEVSESTQKAVGGFLALNDQATLALNQLSWSGQEVTREMADNIAGNFSQMASQVQAGLDNHHEQSLAKIQNFVTSSTALSKAEQDEILNNMQQGYENRKLAVAESEARIKEILDTASTEKRSLTRAEQEEINAIQRQMVDTGIQVLSENEIEAKAIMERMKAQATELTALQAAEVVKNSIEQRDGAIKAANEQYDQVIKEIIRQRDEAGTISKQQADKLITEATRQRNDTVKQAEIMHQRVVQEAQAQAQEHVNQVDWETGEIKTKWQAMKDDIAAKAQAIKENVISTWEEIKAATAEKWESIRSTMSDRWNDIKTNTSETVAAIKTDVSTTWDEVKTKTSETWDNIKTKTAETWQAIQNKIDEHGGGIKGLIGAYTEGYKSVWDSALTTMEEITGIKFSDMADKVTESLDRVKSAISSAIDRIKEWNATSVKEKVFSIVERITRVISTVTSGGGADDNYSGTSFFPGGLTMVGELGPELVALPRGSRIYSDHETKEILGGDKGITQNIVINSPTPLTPAETARRIKNASRQLALEW
jgi:TP901 family phage tail tape measure protein